MEFSKKKLLSLFKQNLNEMPMDFDTPDRPHTDVTNKLGSEETPLKKIPLPKTGREPQTNFQELLASERYKQVVDRVRHLAGLNIPLRPMSQEDAMVSPLMRSMMQAFQNTVRIEAAHKEQLAQLAIEIVIKEMGISRDQFQWDVQIVGRGEIPTDDFNKGEDMNEPQMPEVNIDTEEEMMTNVEQLDLERAKRRFINNIIQGASKRGHYMYQLVPERIRQITGSDTLINDYGILMSINDTLYWQLADQTMGALQGSVGGSEDVDGETEPPTIKVRAVNFPICVHEVIKGIMEVMAIHGQPEDQDMFREVQQSEDTLEKEMWDLRLGPAIWDRLRAQFPEHIITEEDKLMIQNLLLIEIFKLPAKKFLTLMKEVISSSDRGRNFITQIVTSIEQRLRDEENEEVLGQFNNDLDELTDETDEGSLDDFLSQMGIHTKKEDDENDDDDDGGQFVPVRR